MFEFIKDLFGCLDSKQSSSVSPKYDVGGVVFNDVIINKIIELQFSSDNAYISFQLSKCIEEQGVKIGIEHTEFYKTIITRLTATDYSRRPMRLNTDVLSFLSDVHNFCGVVSYSEALYNIGNTETDIVSSPALFGSATVQDDSDDEIETLSFFDTSPVISLPGKKDNISSAKRADTAKSLEDILEQTKKSVM